MGANILASGDWPGDGRDWAMWRGELRESGPIEIGGVRRLGGLGMLVPFAPESGPAGVIVPETAPPEIVNRLGRAGLPPTGFG